MDIRTQALTAYHQAKHTMAQHHAEIAQTYRESRRTWFLQQMHRVFGLEVCPLPASDTIRLEDITFTMHDPRHASQIYVGSDAYLCLLYPAWTVGRLQFSPRVSRAGKVLGKPSNTHPTSAAPAARSGANLRPLQRTHRPLSLHYNSSRASSVPGSHGSSRRGASARHHDNDPAGATSPTRGVLHAHHLYRTATARQHMAAAHCRCRGPYGARHYRPRMYGHREGRGTTCPHNRRQDNL
jgi:hypothetical protein